jgi:hypothetical protein
MPLYKLRKVPESSDVLRLKSCHGRIAMGKSPTPPAAPPSHPNLGKYLAALATDPAKGHALASNPSQEMAKANLTDKEKDVLFRRDKNEMNTILAQHAPNLGNSVINIGTL